MVSGEKIKKYFNKLIFRFRDDDIIALGYQLSYSLLLSFFPFLIFLMTIMGYSNIKGEEVLDALKGILPNSAFDLIYKTVLEVVDTKNPSLLSASFIFTLWTASNGIAAVIKCLNMAYDEKEKRSFLKVQAVSVLCTLALSLIIMFTFLLLVFGEVIGVFLMHLFNLNEPFKYVWNLFRYVIMMLALIFIFVWIYHFTPSRKLGWKEVIPGAVFTTIGWIFMSIGFSYYVNNYTNYSKIYGSIGAIIVLMTWLFFSSVTMLIGGEINAIWAFEVKKTNKNI